MQLGVDLREPQRRQRPLEVARDQPRRDPDLRGDPRELLGVRERAALDLALEHGREHEAQTHDQHEREQAEQAEQRQAGTADGHVHG